MRFPLSALRVDEGSGKKQFTLLRPVKRKRPAGPEPFQRERDRLASRHDHLDDVRCEEGKADHAADLRHLQSFTAGDLGNGRASACSQIRKPAAGIRYERHQLLADHGAIRLDFADDQFDLFAAAKGGQAVRCAG